MPAKPISIAMETTCREGGVCLGAGDELVKVLPFDAARRHATQVVARLEELVSSAGITPREVEELYISCGPGSFTGTRVGITATRTLAQAVGTIKCVGVPTVQVVAENVADAHEIEHLAVVLDARRGLIYSALFEKREEHWAQVSPAKTMMPDELLANSPRPLHVIGEGLGYCHVVGAGVMAVDESLWLPRAESVWRVGRRLAKAGQYTDVAHLLPIYMGIPEAVRKWDERL